MIAKPISIKGAGCKSGGCVRKAVGRSAHQAVTQAQQYIAEGYRWCVDLDLEKFFDRVSHDKLMTRIETRVGDRRCASLNCGNGGVGKDLAAQTAGSAHGPWRLANSPALGFALPNAYFDSLGIPRLTGGR